jgi:iron(III) transport system permease protein
MTGIPIRVEDRRWRLRHRWLFTFLTAVVVSVLAILVLYPLGRLTYSLFFADALGGASSAAEVFREPRLGRALTNTAIVVVVSGGLALVIGSLLAWFNEKTDARIGWAANVLPIIPLLVPPLSGAIGWVFLLAPRAGFVNVFLRSFGTSDSRVPSGPLNIYSLMGMIFVTTLYVVPFVYLVLSAALRNIDSSLVEASRMSGAGPIRTMLHVTLPAVRNALVAASAILVMSIIAMFSVPIVIGSSARIDVLSVVIFNSIYEETPPRVSEAVVLSVFMLVVVQGVVLIEYLVLRRGHHSAVGGRAPRQTMVRLGAAKWPVRLGILLYLGATTLAPIVGLVIVSLQGFWAPDINWSALSFEAYTKMLSPNYGFHDGLLNSLWLAGITATVLIAVAAWTAFYIQNSSRLMGRVVNSMTAIPASVPHTVIAIGFLVSLGVGAFNIGGTLTILFLCYIVLFIPVAARSVNSALSQVGKDLWESSLMSGASPLRTFARVLIPLSWYGLLGGWVIVFAQVLPEVTAGAFLSSPTTNPTVGPSILLVWREFGDFPVLAALTLTLTVVQSVVVLGVLRAGRGRVPIRSM